MEKENNSKLCFSCNNYLSKENKISIKSITNRGRKFNLNQRIENFKSSGISNIDDYDLRYIHITCYEKIFIDPSA